MKERNWREEEYAKQKQAEYDKNVRRVRKGNAGGTGIIALSCYSAFQGEVMMERVNRQDFDFTCAEYDGLDDWGERRQHGPIVFVYHTKDGELHVVKIGQTKILEEATA